MLVRFKVCLFKGVATSVVGLAFFFSWAVTNVDRLQQLAQSQYGSDVARRITDWRLMLQRNELTGELDKLERVNTYINKHIRWAPDIEVWKQEDYWASLLETVSKNAGDCEDFAIAKYVSLLISGVQESKLRLTYVRAQQIVGTPAAAHMILAYYPDPAADPLVLDNFVAEIRPASARKDLTPVYSFNGSNLWIHQSNTTSPDPTARISKWRDVMARLQAEFTL